MEQLQVQIKEIEYESQQRIIFLNDYQTCFINTASILSSFETVHIQHPLEAFKASYSVISNV